MTGNRLYSIIAALPIVAVLAIFFSCAPTRHESADMLNRKSYAFHYRQLDSALCYADSAYREAQHADYGAGMAEAMNNRAFVALMLMDYDGADSMLCQVASLTDNLVEQLVANVQQMRLCQRRADNRQFYEYKERAQHLMERIAEERRHLPPHAEQRMVYAETEYAIVTSTYYYYVGLYEESAEALLSVDERGPIRGDTAQYLNYLYNIGAGGIVNDGGEAHVRQTEFEYLVGCLVLAHRLGYTFFVANALEGLSELLVDDEGRAALVGDNAASMEIIRGVICHYVDDASTIDYGDDIFPAVIAETSIDLFTLYGDPYQRAAACRSLATCFMGIDDYEDALYWLCEALGDERLAQAPAINASIREQLSVVSSALDDKPSSDYNRNIYLDLQEQSRQDRYYEARADMLTRSSMRLNMMIAVVATAIAVLLAMLWLFRRLHKRDTSASTISALLEPLEQWRRQNADDMQEAERRMDATRERGAADALRLRHNERRALEQRAKLSLASSVVPLIDRIIVETEMIDRREESQERKKERYQYIAELTSQINHYNQLLTQWIQMRAGEVSTTIETFPLDPIFRLLRGGKTSFAMRGVTLEVGDTTATVKADRVLTLFMLNTLADNALKATPEGGTVSVYADETPDYVEISVADNGKGIDPDTLHTLLESKTPVTVADDGARHGFGLMNCRGIIDKYRKTSRKMQCCMLSAVSTPGKGSRFFFRLPRGMARLLLPIALCGLAANDASAFDDAALLQLAADYADSAYYCNINADYERTLEFADSCRDCLNIVYISQRPNSQLIMVAIGSPSDTIAEIEWIGDSVDIDYNIILDMRNETAVAALALHEWDVYEYNNSVFTHLYKELTADTSLEAYCDTMLKAQNDKTVAIVMLIVVLFAILPAYYLLYYRHRLYFRLCIDKIRQINTILATPSSPSEKMRHIQRLMAEKGRGEGDFPAQLQQVVTEIMGALSEAQSMQERQSTDIEMAEDDNRRIALEADNLHICNAVVDNCLSTLKHETMYYPSRIAQLISDPDPQTDAVGEVARYYRNLHAILTMQGVRQTQRVPLHIEPLYIKAADVTYMVMANANLTNLLFEILRKEASSRPIFHGIVEGDNDYVVVCVSLGASRLEGIPFLLCRQIMRDLSQITLKRRCGIVTRHDGDSSMVDITLPKAPRGKTPHKTIVIDP